MAKYKLELNFGCQKGINNPSAKLSEEDVRAIVYTYEAGGYSQYRLARLYHVSQSLIHLIVTKQQWTHLWEGESI